MHKYKLTSKQFSLIISHTEFSKQTRQAMKKILVDGATYESTGLSKQFAWKKLQRIKEVAHGLGIDL